MKTKLPKITENEFMGQVLQLAKLHGWRRAHFRPAMIRSGKWITAVQADGKGFPDLVLVRNHRLIFAELKSGRRPCEMQPTTEQKDWLCALDRVPHVEVYLWTPKDWPKIEEVLG